ncbi:hypothetical protein [Rhodoferax sp. BLA1]|uniref:hypothetical protein n=1 Tax=Rhodoferax sp. BLA1 TaxID=2576062 RepID=UPI00351BA61A
MARGKHYHVYVIELSMEVLDNARFMRPNPDYQDGKPFAYVGMTDCTRMCALANTRQGIRPTNMRSGLGGLFPELYAMYNPQTYDRARSLEVELEIDLRED